MSPRLPDIHYRVVKESKCEIVEAEAQVCKLSLQTAAVPEDWQVDGVTNRYGKGSEGNPKNCKLGSLASFPSIHLSESVLKDKITDIMKTWINIVC